MKKQIMWYEWIYLIAALFTLLSGIRDFGVNSSIMKDGITTIGVVIDVRSEVTGEVYISTIEYKLETGKVYKIESQTEYPVGKELTIRYSKGNPSKAVVLDFDGLWFWPSFKVLMGLIVVFALKKSFFPSKNALKGREN